MTSLLRQLKSGIPSFNFISNRPTTYLGRWKIENDIKTYRKADYANNDHCGVCSFSIDKNESIESVDDDNESYYSYFMVESIPDK